MMNRISTKDTFTIGLMLFALFFGAGNMIFPPSLGQGAGTSLWVAILGFLATGVGLPLLAVTAIARMGGDLQDLASRVHPKFSVVFTFSIYLAIGPLLAIPRTGTVAFEMGAVPFLPTVLNAQGWPLFVYTLVYFGITYWLALNPSKLVGRIGNLLTPVLLIVIAVLVLRAIFSPLDDIGAPSEAYAEAPFFKGLIEGYFTLDALAALVFGIVVISAVQSQGVTDRRALTAATIKAAVIAAIGLSLVYVSLGYVGAISLSLLGPTGNGGEILSTVAHHLLGTSGSVLLGVAITLACLTTSVGLVTACGEYFTKLWPSVSYHTFVVGLALFSMGLANMGLNQILAFSVPVLLALYPLAMTLIALSFISRLAGASRVYVGAMIGTAIVSIVDALKSAGLNMESMVALFGSLPLYDLGLGWVLPAVIGGGIGYVLEKGKSQGEQVKRKVS
ncbi:branched-chain amino acid transport system II carrier protein [Ammoniphilus sp. YIM 78166]|uniref:branched-chain amino acid transport system II carrier protein n=1 Tax=Ammoniphilus sp. YIM 78166 TaxID=1644106 RepID=UPI00351663EC